MRISDWSSVVCSSDLPNQTHPPFLVERRFSKADPIATGTHLGLPAIGVSAMDRREFLGSSLGATAVVPNLLLPAFLSPESISRNIPDDYAAARFRNAREFMGGLEAHALQDHESFLYSAGIVTQLGLTAYLFGKGLTDDW